MKNILIIGGSSGLGYELAKQLLVSANVYITGRTKPDNLPAENKFHSSGFK